MRNKRFNMVDTNHSGGGCCGGAAKAAQSGPHRSSPKPVNTERCGCAAPEGIVEESGQTAVVVDQTPVAVEKSGGGCCGGKDGGGHHAAR